MQMCIRDSYMVDTSEFAANKLGDRGSIAAKGIVTDVYKRQILVGLVRDANKSMATRFELRSPHPKSNTYLVLASSYMDMLDGIEKALQLSLIHI